RAQRVTLHIEHAIVLCVSLVPDRLPGELIRLSETSQEYERRLHRRVRGSKCLFRQADQSEHSRPALTPAAQPIQGRIVEIPIRQNDAHAATAPQQAEATLDENELRRPVRFAVPDIEQIKNAGA